MVVHWWRRRGSGGWRRSIAINAIGCALTAVVFLIAAITKFTAGAWVSLLIIVVLTAAALRTRRYFDRVLQVTSLSPEAPAEEDEETPSQVSNLVIVPVPYLDRPTMRALAYAVSLHQPVLALHVSPTEEEAARFRSYWADWGNHVPLEVVESPYRAVVPPTIAYIEALHAQRPELTLTVAVADLAVRHWWQRLLYEDTAMRLRHSLAALPGVLVTSVPFHV
jgi:hypothetical protein